MISYKVSHIRCLPIIFLYKDKLIRKQIIHYLEFKKFLFFKLNLTAVSIIYNFRQKETTLLKSCESYKKLLDFKLIYVKTS